MKLKLACLGTLIGLGCISNGQTLLGIIYLDRK